MSKNKSRINRMLEKQSNRLDRRSIYEVHKPFFAPQPYTDPLKFCVNLIRNGKCRSDATFLTRLHFTDPRTPGYIPIERWNSDDFERYLRIWFKCD